MSPELYEHAPEACDVSDVGALRRYRAFRTNVLNLLVDGDHCVQAQLQDLLWDSAVFSTLNEARRLEPGRQFNAPMWDLCFQGYVAQTVLGIRRLVDRRADVISLPKVYTEISKHRSLLTREHFVCHDGLPFDSEAAETRWRSQFPQKGPRPYWLPKGGPLAFGQADYLHQAFDRVTGHSGPLQRGDTITAARLTTIHDRLARDPIPRIHKLVDTRFAHMGSKPIAASIVSITLNEIDQALGLLAQATDEMLWLFGRAFGDPLPTAQFNVLQGLDRPWVQRKNLPALQAHWDKLHASGWPVPGDQRGRGTASPGPQAL